MSKALWHESDKFSELREEVNADQKRGMLKVRSLYSLISTGTERLVATGKVPQEAAEAMKVPFMEGSFSFPVKYGYSLVGEVVSEGELAGKMVHLLHPHQDELMVENEVVFEVPASVPAKRATLASNMETAINAVWDAGISVGDRVVVAGFGLIGSLVSRVIQMMPGVELAVLEKDDNKRKLAHEMGFAAAGEVTPGYFDKAINTTASGEALQKCIESVGQEGIVVELSWYGTHGVNLKLGADFHYQRKKILSSQVSRIPENHSARWNYHRRKQVVFELLKSAVFDEHITRVIPFEESPAFFHELRNGQYKGLGCCIRY